jgi:hypothetical protein
MLGLSLALVYLNVGLLAWGRASYKDDQDFRWVFSTIEPNTVLITKFYVELHAFRETLPTLTSNFVPNAALPPQHNTITIILQPFEHRMQVNSQFLSSDVYTITPLPKALPSSFPKPTLSLAYLNQKDERA